MGRAPARPQSPPTCLGAWRPNAPLPLGHAAYPNGRAATCCGRHTERPRFFRIVISFGQPRQNAGFRSGDFHAEATKRQRAQRGKLRRRRGTREPATSQNVSCRHESPAWIACQLRQGETRRSTQSISALSASPHLCVRQNDDARDDGRQARTTARRWWVGVGGRGTPQEGNLTQTPPPFLPGALLYKSWVDESPCGYHVMRVGTPAACRASLIWAIV